MNGHRTLAVSLVSFQPDLGLLHRTMRALHAALTGAVEQGMLSAAVIWLVDNDPPGTADMPLRAVSGECLAPSDWLSCGLISGHGNIGYGRGHNLAIKQSSEDYHLVLNPDALLAPDAISAAMEFMERHGDVGLLAPRFLDAAGTQTYLCKRYPTVFDLLLRGFAPAAIRQAFQTRLDRYEMRDLVRDQVVFDVPIVSGACMLFRRSTLAATGGFDPDYFLYFEDFDLSLRAGQVARIAYVPAVQVVHLGGHTARKGLRHIAMFGRSACTFFNRHGWRWR